MSTVCLISVSLSILCLLLGCVVAGAGTNYFDYIVVGAGPGGLQLGYFLQQNNRNYIILERNNVSGSFFSTYPRHDMLISINKRHTGKINKEFNLRHDWNSLISHDDSLLFKHYSKEFFPDRRDMLRYLDDYQRKLGIQVQFNTEVRNIHKKDDLTSGESYFHMNDQLGNHFICKTLVLATGLGKPNIPKFNGSEYTEGYETLSTNPDDYEGQTVLILGRGNSAFEVANSIYGATNMVHMMGRSRVHLSWATHYVGDLRGVNNNLLDTYQLKSLDGLFEGIVDGIVFYRNESIGKISLSTIFGVEDFPDNNPVRDHYDRILRCLGFRFEDGVFAEGVNNDLLDTYQLKSLDAMFEAPVEFIVLRRNESSGKIKLSSTSGAEDFRDNFAVRELYDRVLVCLGFHFEDRVFTKAVNSQLLDTYMLKSQDALLEAGLSALSVKPMEDGQFFIDTISYAAQIKDNFALRDTYDRVLRCLGFRLDSEVFGKAVNNNLLDTYQLKSLDGLVEKSVESIHLQRSPSGTVLLKVEDSRKNLFEVRSAEEYHRVLLCLGFRFDESILSKAVNNDILDTYLLKSLDGIAEHQMELISLRPLRSGKILMVAKYGSRLGKVRASHKYHRVLRCLGFRFDSSLISTAVNNNLLDTYQLKSQDAVFEAPVEQLYVHRSARGRFHLTDYGSEFDNFALREEYDKVIRCLGFKFEPGVFGKAVNSQLLDTYMLKSQDALLEAGLSALSVKPMEDGQFFIDTISYAAQIKDNFALRDTYDRVLRCLGFRLDSEVFGKAVNNNLLDTYQLKSLDGLVEKSVESIHLQRSPSGTVLLKVEDSRKNLFEVRSAEEYHRVLLCLGFRFDESILSKAVNNDILDTYLLKSLDGIAEHQMELISLRPLRSGKILMVAKYGSRLGKVRASHKYHRVLRCLGFRFDSSLISTAVNNNLLDTYQLKSQDAVFEAPVEQLYVHRSARGRFHLTDYGSEFDNFALREEYDKVIRCLGFKFEPGVFGNDTSVLKLLQQEKKYPEIHPNYESVHVPNLFFTGTNSHGLDHKQSSGGFIHGFRYTTRALSRLLEWKNHGVPWTSTRYHVRDLLTVITKRINEVSALYQMFGGFMGDIYVFREEGNVVDFLPEVPLHLLPELETHTGHSWAPMIVVSLEYGPDFSGPGKDVFRGDRATGEPSEAHTSNFLHPVYYYYESSPTKQDFERKQKQKKKYKYYNLPQPKRIHFTIEDFLTLWDAEKSHILPLRRFIENILETDLRNHFAEECMKMALVFSNVPYKCDQFLEGQGILGTNALVEAAFKSGLMLS